MRIDVKGRNFEVTDDVREKIAKRVEKIGRQVSELAQLEVELREEQNPRLRERFVAEATLHLKGVTLRAVAQAESVSTAVSECTAELARQVKKHREKRRARRPSVRVQGEAAAP